MENVYQENGFKNRRAYLESLAEDFNLPIPMVFSAAAMLGPDEDFDGLVTMLEDEAAKGDRS